MMRGYGVPVRLAGSSLGPHRHVCAFFDSRDDEYRTLLPFSEDGIARGERIVHIMPQERRSDHVGRLRSSGIDVDALESRHQFELLQAEQTYTATGHFDGDAMLSVIRSVLSAGRALGFPLTRLMAHADHVLSEYNGDGEVIEYESRLNFLLPRFADPVICTYDLTRISAVMAIDVMRTHPMVIVGGLLQENPFFVPPDVFLRELDERRAHRPPALTRLAPA